jgi:hypothetical protein
MTTDEPYSDAQIAAAERQLDADLETHRQQHHDGGICDCASRVPLPSRVPPHQRRAQILTQYADADPGAFSAGGTEPRGECGHTALDAVDGCADPIHPPAEDVIEPGWPLSPSGARIRGYFAAGQLHHPADVTIVTEPSSPPPVFAAVHTGLPHIHREGHAWPQEFCPACREARKDAAQHDDPTGQPWVVILGSHLPYHASAAWLIPEGEQTAREFAAYVTAEVDPAQAMPLMSAAGELMHWREQVALPAMERERKATALADRWAAASRYTETTPMDPVAAAVQTRCAAELRAALGLPS